MNAIPVKVRRPTPRLAPEPEPDPEPVPEPTPEALRAAAVEHLSRLGRQRLRQAADLAAIDHQLRPLAVAAAHAGVPYRRIAELTGISPATIGRWATQ